jgi:hypothetical protein
VCAECICILICRVIVVCKGAAINLRSAMAQRSAVLRWENWVNFFLIMVSQA